MEPQIHLLKPTIQTYAWGSKTAIAELIGQPNPGDEPQAELWMGAHPKAPSRVVCADQRIPLNEAIAAYPREILGPAVAEAFSDQLPFLFKVLAAEEPLSIQAHPNLEQAREGFARENAAGIRLDAPDRNYRDDNHKPELICALTEFWALSGFRRPETIPLLFERLGVSALETCLAPLRQHPDRDGLRAFFETLMALPEFIRRHALEQTACGAARDLADPVRRGIVELRHRYPDDVGALAPAFLNLVRLAPGEALYMPAGELHAYVRGMGVEIMANSDNVLRGALTPKHVDVPELLRVLTFRGADAEVRQPARESGGEWVYPSPAREFQLSRIDVGAATPFRSADERSVEILLCVEGSARVSNANMAAPLALPRGASVLVPACSPAYTIEGEAQVFKAAVPRPESSHP